MGRADAAGLRRLLAAVEASPADPAWPYREPPPAVTPTPAAPPPDDATLGDRLLGAWLGRCAGCTLGKPVENWPRAAVRRYLDRTGDHPVNPYRRLALPYRERGLRRDVGRGADRRGVHRPGHARRARARGAPGAAGLADNATVIAAALLWGEGDFTRTIGLAVEGGWDTDCNGATAGSAFGAMHCAGALPEHWTQPLGG